MTPARRRFPRPLAALLGLGLAVGVAEVAARVAGVGEEPAPVAPYGRADAEALAAWQARVGGREDFLAAHRHDSELGWVPAPGLVDHVQPGHPPLSTNSAGMRGRAEFPVERAAGALRIAMVGDSFTFGTHQPDGAIWAARVAEALGSPGAEVLNFGVPGYGTDQALLRLERDVLPYGPDVVVWGIFETNPERSRRLFSFYAKPRFDLAGGALTPAVERVPAPAELLDANWTRRAGPFDLHLAHWIRLARSGPIGAGAPDLVPLHEALLARGAAACEAAGARLLVVTIPTLRFAERDAPATEVATLRLADELGFGVLDLRAVFRTAAAGAAPPIYIPGRHFSPEGHWLVANAVALALRQRGWHERP